MIELNPAFTWVRRRSLLAVARGNRRVLWHRPLNAKEDVRLEPAHSRLRLLPLAS